MRKTFEVSFASLPLKERICDGLVYRTYFGTRKNEILYYNNIFGEGDPRSYNRDKYNLFWFMTDIVNGVYLPVEFSKINYFTGKNKSLLFRLKSKFYILSNEIYKEEHIDTTNPPNYVGVIDANTGETLYIENRKNSLCLDLFYPIANIIVPVIQIDNSMINVHLVDTLSQQINTLSWTLDKIEPMVMDILYKFSNPKPMKYVLEKLKFRNF